MKFLFLFLSKGHLLSFEIPARIPCSKRPVTICIYPPTYELRTSNTFSPRESRGCRFHRVYGLFIS